MSRKRLLLVEDEADMADLVAARLKREGYEVIVAGDGATALDRVRAEPPDLAIVDIMLPHMSGTDLVAEMRQDPRTAGIPVIMLTAKAEESDIVVGLSLGADDYITKPFSLSVLAARVSAVLRRAALARSGKGPVHVGPLVLDVDRHLVQVKGRAVTLTLTEFRLLAALAAARGRVLTRNQLIDQAIGPNTIVTDRTIDVHLTSLRRKLGTARTLVRTVRGIGYRLAEEGEGGDES
jgi:DNA-binding response OmpR family regulator